MRKPEVIDAEFEVITPARETYWQWLRRRLINYSIAFAIGLTFYFPAKWLHGVFAALIDPLFSR